MNQLTHNQLITSRRITRSTQSQAPSRTTHLKSPTTHLSKSLTIHLSQNHTTLHTNHRLILNHRRTTPHRTSITPTLSQAMDMRPRMEHLKSPTTHLSKIPTTHLSQNHTTLRTNHRLILNHLPTIHLRTSITPTLSQAMDMRPRMEHLHHPLFMHMHHQLLHH